MAEWVEVLADKPGNLNLILWFYMVGDKNSFLHIIHYMHARAGAPPHLNILNRNA